MTEQDQGQWYSNKDLFEMMRSLEKKITDLCMVLTRITESRVIERLEECEQKLSECKGKEKGGKDAWGYIVGGIGIIIALISRFGG